MIDLQHKTLPGPVSQKRPMPPNALPTVITRNWQQKLAQGRLTRMNIPSLCGVGRIRQFKTAI
jgi:hypothetical protein